jgi:hypothetical protein
MEFCLATLLDIQYLLLREAAEVELIQNDPKPGLKGEMSNLDKFGSLNTI